MNEPLVKACPSCHRPVEWSRRFSCWAMKGVLHPQAFTEAEVRCLQHPMMALQDETKTIVVLYDPAAHKFVTIDLGPIDPICPTLKVKFPVVN